MYYWGRDHVRCPLQALCASLPFYCCKSMDGLDCSIICTIQNILLWSGCQVICVKKNGLLALPNYVTCLWVDTAWLFGRWHIQVIVYSIELCLPSLFLRRWYYIMCTYQHPRMHWFIFNPFQTFEYIISIGWISHIASHCAYDLDIIITEFFKIGCKGVPGVKIICEDKSVIYVTVDFIEFFS